MSAYKIGQRVRYVRRLNAGHEGISEIPLGSEGRITRLVHFPAGSVYSGKFFTKVDLNAVVEICGQLRSCHTDQLEPILYDGNQLVSWESMKDLWTPSEVAA